MMILVTGSLYWAVMAEIKVFFLELILIAAISIFFVKGRIDRKICLLLTGSIGMAIAIALISYVFPNQAFVFRPKGLIEYAVKTNVGVGRLFAIPRIMDRLFKNNILLELFGIGLGNGEMMDLGPVVVESRFFSQYGTSYAYTTYFYAMVFVERGMAGLIWYIWLYGRSFKIACIKRKKGRFIALNHMVMILVICFFIIAVYDASLKTSSGGYMGCLILAVPYMSDHVLSKRKQG